MASSSDSIYNVLYQIKRHPEMARISEQDCTNVIGLSVPDATKVADSEFYFPDNKLMVNCLSGDFVAQHGDLLDYFYEQTQRTIPDYHNVWVTSSHLTNHNRYFLELSFE